MSAKILLVNIPADLQEAAMTNEISDAKTESEFIKQFCEEENTDESRAKKQIMAVWRALKDAITSGEINDIKSQLPSELAKSLH